MTSNGKRLLWSGLSLLLVALFWALLWPVAISEGTLASQGLLPRKQDELALLAESVTLLPTGDTYIDSVEKDVNFSTRWVTYLRIKTPDQRRPMLRFNLSSIPVGSTVLRAELYLTTNNYVHVPGRPLHVRLHKLNRHWVPTEATWRKATASTLWQTEGADHPTDREESAVCVTIVDKPNTEFSWNITSLVQEWVNNPASNHGVILIGDVMSTEFRFYSVRDPDTRFRPRLAVTYVSSVGTPTPTRTASPTVTPTPTMTATAIPVNTATPTPTMTATSVVMNTATPTPTATEASGVPTATPSATVWGQVHLQARPPSPHSAWVMPLTVQVSGGGVFRVSTDEFGRFMLTLPAMRTYSMQLKGSTTLSKARNHVFLPAGVTHVDFGTLLAGDANHDNVVDIADFSILRSLFGSTRPEADFNGDGLVNIFDFSLLRTNFGHSGEVMIPVEDHGS